MARIFTDGAETGDDFFWDINVTTAVAAATTPKRSGQYSYVLNGTTEASVCKKNILGVTELYARWGLYLGNYHTNPIGFSFRDGGTVIATLALNTDTKKVEYYRGNKTSLLATGITSIQLNQWYLYEVYFKLDDSVGRYILKLDGITQFDFTGDTNPAAAEVNLIGGCGGSVSTSWMDDLALNDTNGAIDNSWCGDGQIVALVPNGDNGTPQWIGSDGNNTNNYQLIDELPPSSSDYVRATGSAYTDVYNLSTVNLAGQTIQRIWLVARARSDASGDYFLHGIQVSGSNYLVTGSLPTSWGRIDSFATGTWALNPYTGGAWSQEQLDNLLLVIKAPG